MTRRGDGAPKPFTFAVLRTFDLDLRLSAAHLDFYGQTITDAAASVIVQDGKFDMSLLDAAAYGGRLQGEAAVVFVGQDLKASTRGELVDADLGAAMATLDHPNNREREGAIRCRGLRSFASRRDR